MISAPADVKRFNAKTRLCAFCGKTIESADQAEHIVTRNLSRSKWSVYLHTGCVYASQKIRRAYNG